MGWGDCGTDVNGRPIGYLYESTCDHPGCNKKIDRGLSVITSYSIHYTKLYDAPLHIGNEGRG